MFNGPRGECKSPLSFKACDALACCQQVTESHVLFVAFIVIIFVGTIMGLLYYFCIRRVLERKVAKPIEAEQQTRAVEKIDRSATPLKNDILLSQYLKNIMVQKGVQPSAKNPNEYAWQTFRWWTVQSVGQIAAPPVQPRSKKRLSSGRDKNDIHVSMSAVH